MFVDMERFLINVKSLINAPAVVFLSGFLTLILGLIMVVRHWKWDWRVVITIISRVIY